jgi:hypothetical protein
MKLCRREAFFKDVEAVAHATPTMSIESLTHSNINYTANVPVVTINPPHPDEKPVGSDNLRVMLNFGEHAREFISSETGLHFLRMLSFWHQNTPRIKNVDAGTLRLIRCCVTFKVLCYACPRLCGDFIPQ